MGMSRNLNPGGCGEQGNGMAVFASDGGRDQMGGALHCFCDGNQFFYKNM